MKQGADSPKSSSFTLGHGQATFTTDKYDGKAHALNGHGTFRLLVLVVLKIGRLQGEENKSKSSMLYYIRENRQLLTQVNRISDLTVLQIPVSDTDSA